MVPQGSVRCLADPFGTDDKNYLCEDIRMTLASRLLISAAAMASLAGVALAKNHAMPTMSQAGDYASVLHYLKALDTLGGNPHDGAKVVAKMKEIPTDDPLFGKGVIRVDGRKIHPAYLFEVKKPAESKYPGTTTS
jgi:Periplasmic binding protein